MGIFFTAVLISALVYLSISQIFRNLYGPEPHEENSKWLPVIQVMSLLCLLCNLCVKIQLEERALLTVSSALVAVYPLSCSVIPEKWWRALTMIASGLEIAVVAAGVICSGCCDVELPEVLLSYLSSASCCAVVILFLAGIYRRIRDIKVVMRAGSVWTMLCLSVDAVYASVILMYGLLLPVIKPWISIVLLSSVLFALCIRIRNHSEFVFLVNHERRIVESMRLSQAECIGDNPGTDILYDNIYERILRYFEGERPYLDNGLTINNVADVIFTNKVYISRAINHCTGRNFCQFVNYHRVSHAVELFRKDPQLKIIEMANRSGFNSTTSFNNAFRLYMGEKPGEWCRKERARMAKK